MKIIENKIKTLNISMFICIFLFYFFACNNVSAQKSPKILIINSNINVEKYKIVQEEFKKSIAHSAMEVNLYGHKVTKKDKKNMTSYDADLIYCIGSKAFSLANKHFKKKAIVFSSIMNWLRIPLPKKTYGVSNELHARMSIFMFRYFFPKIKKIGVLYSKQYTYQWLKKARKQASELKVEVIGKRVNNKRKTFSALKKLIPNVNAIWLIPDPIVMSKKSYLYKILKLCDEKKMPIFSYHEAFAKFGAVLTVSVDNPTIGRQAANLAMELLLGNKIEEKVQYPAGSYVTLNMKKLKEYDLDFNKNALHQVSNIIR